MIDCSKCPERGTCCGIIPMDKSLIEYNKDKFQVTPVKIVETSDKCAVLTDDILCIFLNRETKLCSIYDKRPEVCKLYGVTKYKDLLCPYFKSNGKRRSEASQKQVERHIKKLTNNFLRTAK